MERQEGLFALNGITGMLIATVLLLSILAFLVTNAVGVQNANASNYYKIDNAHSIQMFSTENTKHLVDAK